MTTMKKSLLSLFIYLFSQSETIVPEVPFAELMVSVCDEVKISNLRLMLHIVELVCDVYTLRCLIPIIPRVSSESQCLTALKKSPQDLYWKTKNTATTEVLRFGSYTGGI